MGREVVNAVLDAGTEFALVGAADPAFAGSTISEAIGMDSPIAVERDLNGVLASTKADAVVVFSIPSAGMADIRTAMAAGAVPVVGTTGITQENVEEIRELAKKHGVGAIIAPNFAIGAVLMMKMACEAVKYFPAVEIIELHHDKKLDAPSGTAILTAKLLAQAREEKPSEAPDASAPARGGDFDGIRVHSVRLPGYEAHQEVVFGGQGQTLTIRHDAFNRKSYVPGILLAIRKSLGLKDVIWGLENII